MITFGMILVVIGGGCIGLSYCRKNTLLMVGGVLIAVVGFLIP